mmetsp:Transcript_9131/g.13633  ORF Transcript_9131/g.13633 Transcript_9131/m.13633 type:complete len:234 (-) Transcript_9131:23-724(-)
MSNWDLIVSYLKDVESNSLHSGLIDRLIDANIATGINAASMDESGDIPEVVPICLVLISRNAKYLGDYGSQRHSSLQKLLESVWKAIEMANINQIEKNGEVFESFVHRALMVRLELLRGKEKVRVPLSQLFPGPKYKGVVLGSSMKRSFFLHNISSKEHLKKFLLPPLYYLFPVGLDSFSSSPSIQVNRSNLNDWVQNNSEKYQFHDISPHDLVCECVNQTLQLNGNLSDQLL